MPLMHRRTVPNSVFLRVKALHNVCAGREREVWLGDAVVPRGVRRPVEAIQVPGTDYVAGSGLRFVYI